MIACEPLKTIIVEIRLLGWYRIHTNEVAGIDWINSII